jgi:branched-chain amino acid transport system substrate-binding protein
MKRLMISAAVLLLLAVLMAVGPALAGDVAPIKLGVPLSRAYLYGWAAERGIQLAVDQINRESGVKVGEVLRPLELSVIDTRDLEPAVPVDDAVKAVEKLILQKKVDFLVGGPCRSEAALAVMDLLGKHKKISILSTGVLTPAYHQAVEQDYDRYKYCFRITSDIRTLGRDLMTVFENIRAAFGFDRVSIMVQDVSHARKAGEFVAKLLVEKGFDVVGHEIYPTGSTDFAPGLLRLRQKKAQFLFIWMDMPETAVLLKQWKDFRLKSLPIGFICAAEQPGFWKASKGSAEFTIVNLVNGGNAPSSVTPATMKFVNAYKKRWGKEPEGYGTSSSYMAVYALKEAIEQAETLAPDAVIKALESIEIDGVYGKIRFDPKTHQVVPATDPGEGAVGCVFQWQEGRRVTIWPETGAAGSLKLPPWMKK